MSVENLHGKSHDHWVTPDWLYDFFREWFDPCPLIMQDLEPDQMMDGLDLEWKDKTFVNPPYSDPDPWVSRAISKSKRGKRIVMLLKVDSSTKWWLKLVEAGAHFAWFISDGKNSGRLAFSGSDKAAFPSVLVFLEASSKPPTESITRESEA